MVMVMGGRILIVDDEPQILRVLRTALRSAGYDVLSASDGLDGYRQFETVNPDLIITDLAMPEMDGVALTEAVRRIALTPIIVLSVRNQDAMKVQALDSGANDYLTKPFSMPELLARVRVQLRRVAEPGDEAQNLAVGDFLVDSEARAVTVNGLAVHLTPKEMDLLILFLRNPRRVLTHRFLLRAIWGPAGEGQPEYLRVLIGQLRKKIERKESTTYIQSEPWVGYRLWPNGVAGE
jgi:two-component system KDP operon response regulator KdpE